MVSTDLEAEPQLIRLRISRLHLANGWVVKPARDITLSVPLEAIMRRAIAAKTYEPVDAR